MNKLIAVLALTLFASSAQADQVYLYTVFHDDNSTGERFRVKMESMVHCIRAVTNAKLSTPEKVGGDYEVMAAMWCGGEFQRQYNGSWREYGVKVN